MDKLIRGSGGGGGDSHTPVEAPNTLISNSTARVLFLLSAGETGGLADQTDPLKSVFFNNVPVMNSDGSVNFAKVTVAERVGLTSQEPISGFNNATASYNVASKVTTGTPVAYTSTTSDVDAIRVTIRFPALFEQAENGDTNGTSVTFRIYRKLGAGSYTLVNEYTKTDKCIAPADVDYTIARPSGAGVWSVRVDRVTADNASTTKANDIYFQTSTEIKYANLSYDNYAVIGVAATSETTGSRYPTVAFDYNGIKVKVPNNYNTTTRAYTGEWSGTFSSTLQVCDNPVWVLYYLLTNAENGLGISESYIDKFAFYDAAKHNDELVPAVVNGAITGTEPRYTFNYQYFDQRQSGWSVIQGLAATFGSIVFQSGNFITLVQDRPTASSRLITNSNVIDGRFEYVSSHKDTRTTAAVVYWTNPNENWTATPTYYEDADAIDRYGYNLKEVTGIGITSEGQALRLAKWYVETSISNTLSVTFKVGFKNAGLLPGDVITIADTDYAMANIEARIISKTSSTITLDRSVSVTSGNKFQCVGADGTSIVERTISATSSGTTVTYSGGDFSGNAGADVVFYITVSPRPFKITAVKEEKSEAEIFWTISAVSYDSTKFGRVDDTPTGPTPVYQAQNFYPSAVTNLTFKESSVNDNNIITRKLLISWTRPTSGVIDFYKFRLRRGISNWEDYDLKTTSFEVSPANDGQYDVEVYAVSTKGIVGPKTEGTYTISITGGETSDFLAPTNLKEYTNGGTVFAEDDLKIIWTNPTGNNAINATLRDFEVRFINVDTDAVLRIEYANAVTPGSTQVWTYSYANNLADGGPRRKVKVEVRCRDTNNNLSNEVSATFNNPAPGTPPNFTVTSGLRNNKITYDVPGDLDYEGVLIWRGFTSGFTLEFSSLIFDGTDQYVVDSALDGKQKAYYRIAAYDSFAKDYTGAGLNVSAELSVTTQDISIDNNLLRNSNFEGQKTTEADGTVSTDAGRPVGYADYAYDGSFVPISVSWVGITGTGYGSQKSFGLKANASTTNVFGLATAGYEEPDGYGVAGGWVSGQDYVISFYAKKVNGASWAGMKLYWDYPPENSGATGLSEEILNPTLTTSYQRYAFHIRWHTGATVQAEGGLYMSVNGNTVANDEIYIDKIQVEKGETYTAWTPRVDELTPGSITSTFIADDSVTTPKLVTEAVVAGKIAAEAVSAYNILAETITANKVALNTLTGDRIAANTIKTSNLLVSGGDGASLIPDTNTTDISAWYGDASGITIVADTTSPTASALASSTNEIVLNANPIPIDAAKNYTLRMWAKQQSGTSHTYLCVGFYDAAGAQIYGYATPAGWPDEGSFYYFGLTDVVMPGTWTEYTINFGPSETAHFPTGAKYIRVGFLANYSGTGAQRITGVRLVERISSALIVTGGVTADKISVSSLSAITATIGTLRTASSGQRVEILDNKIVVYDASNNVRVKIGDLS